LTPALPNLSFAAAKAEGCHAAARFYDEFIPATETLMIRAFGDAAQDATTPRYSDVIVVEESFVPCIPDGLDRAAAAPFLCAGITTYSPLRRWRVQPGQRVGIDMAALGQEAAA
jgi:NADPH:quinone reductase-like Zn-dependent oxidoreductase